MRSFDRLGRRNGFRVSCRRALVAALALVLLGIGCSEGGEGEDAETRERAPDFSLDLLGGDQVVTLSELRGKTIVIDFWATWCPPCVFQVPELNAFFDSLPSDSAVQVYGISIDIGGAEKVAKWADEQGVRYPILLGDEDLARQYGAVGFPTLFVIGPDGSVDSRHIGIIERDALEAAVKRSAGS